MQSCQVFFFFFYACFDTIFTDSESKEPVGDVIHLLTFP